MNSLGLPKRPQDTRVVVAMSGGVDSSVTAAVLREEGYDVVGITLQLYDHGLALQKPGACCAGQDIYDARQVADRIGIPHYVLDYEGRFSQDVMDDFADSYLRGETPIPCVRCNQRVKFRDLLNTARDLGAEALATGHYVRRIAGPQGAELHRAVDPAKDQSYFLFATTREQLEFLRFPLGGLTKPETRALAERHGLEVAAKPDSQDICFVPNGNYAEVVAKLRPGSVEPGDIVHVDGRVLGRHKGVVHYTVGQRKGLGIGGIRGQQEEALYVVRLEPARRRVVVGPRRDLARSLVMVRDVNWLGPDLAPDTANGAGIEVSVKLRSAQPAAPALWRAGPDGTAQVELLEPQHGIAPGQACVVYQGDRVLGGGWISATAGSVGENAAKLVGAGETAA
ncbi:tRNA 2-thiouridine(34) synthase MnmA [Azospirillum melinis]|uniref:tRNA-specific 2-thiouridylase MnmA n=1 Tax=Azospirillum melinis TaxID=328839 RepID=A0ABX2K8X0_9PROT|nr:tRNA 2-thiouridine(34) synthase MnmA [Azospirillum melinis]MBP2304708.1 tRNA-specific 2-thiouridylase [Azospirillum melinis]NUA98901.1 tRNA 2-thiouridine(34) synthase MnmA [Azospirillum melinis]